MSDGRLVSAASADVGDAWAAYSRAQRDYRAAADTLTALSAAALVETSRRRYRGVMVYLLAHAPAAVRACFLRSLLDDTLTATIFTRACITAIATVDTPTVRAALGEFAWRVLEADPDDSDAAALHLLWLYSEFGAVRLILDAWGARPGGDILEGFAESHPMPQTAAGGAALSKDRVAPEQRGPETGSADQPETAELEAAAQAWDAFWAAHNALGPPSRAVRSLDQLAVVEHALTVAEDREVAPWLLADRFRKDGFAAAVALLGSDFFTRFFPLLLNVAAVNTFEAAAVLRALRLAARKAGRGDLWEQANQLELTTYGIHDAQGLLVKLHR